MRKPAPYCSPQMLSMLRRIAAGEGRDVPNMAPHTIATVYASLRSRGWINNGGQVTDDGREWLDKNEGK